MMHKSLDKFKPYLEKKLLRQVISPCNRLVLYNYTDLCTYEKAWDDVTLNARGTVYEIATGKVVARAFDKMFNFGELQTEKQKEILTETNFEVFEKMDGSLGIVYFYDGEWRVNTRGSFTSDQAIKGKEILDTKYKDVELYDDATFLVEIIYPQNKIIVDYGVEEKLVLLGIIDTESHVEYDLDYEANMSRDFKLKLLPFAPKSTFSTIDEVLEHLATLDHTEEGYVVRLESGYRIKFKSAEYLRIARMISCMTPLAFWKAMEMGKVKVDYLEHLPEEFREEADNLVFDLELKYKDVRKSLDETFRLVTMALMIDPAFPDPNDRKRIGLFCKDKGINPSGIFARLDLKGDIIDKLIMKEIRPKGNEL